MKKNNKYKKGFSLPEVLMACAVFAILSTIAIPIYMNYTERAEDIAVEVHLNDFKMAVDRYYNANRNYPMLDNTSWSSHGGAPKPDDLRILSAYGFSPDRNIYLYAYRIMAVQGVEVSFEVKAFHLPKDEKDLNLRFFYYSGYTDTIRRIKAATAEKPADPGWGGEEDYFLSSPESIDWKYSLGYFISNQGWR